MVFAVAVFVTFCGTGPREIPFVRFGAIFSGAGAHAGLNRQGMLAQALGLGELGEQLPGLLSCTDMGPPLPLVPLRRSPILSRLLTITEYEVFANMKSKRRIVLGLLVLSSKEMGEAEAKRAKPIFPFLQ
jgi:hypothetical protein